jgi:metal-responsive CopG/Arc/MetJ family transcriptional regulator
MASIKTAISLQESLLGKVDALAQELDISRSRLFVLAAEEFIQRHRNRELLEAINIAYDDSSDTEEEMLRQKMRHKHRRLVERQW